jgi:hypothetical protein
MNGGLFPDGRIGVSCKGGFGVVACILKERKGEKQASHEFRVHAYLDACSVEEFLDVLEFAGELGRACFYCERGCYPEGL